jgi:hypothetical protein
VAVVVQVFLYHLLQNHMQILDQELKGVMIYDYIEIRFDADANSEEEEIKSHN